MAESHNALQSCVNMCLLSGEPRQEHMLQQLLHYHVTA